MKIKLKLRTYLLLTLVLSSLSVPMVVSSASKFNTIKVKETLYTTKESIFQLPKAITEKLVGISLCDDQNSVVASEFNINNNKLTVRPATDLRGDKSYTIKIYTSDNKKHQIKVIAKNIIEIDDSKNSYIKISTNPEKGYNYPYYLLIPKGTSSNKGQKHIIVEPNNTGTPSDILAVHETAVRIALHEYNDGTITGGAGGYEVATELKMPLLIPVFPRPTSYDGLGIYTHSLTRDAMTVKDVDYERLDLQLLAMIKDAQRVLGNEKIEVEKKVFMIGFSASSKFAHRFAIMHPDYVRAIAVGGVNGILTFPTDKINGTTVRYPVGISDLESITGIKFNMNAYKKISQYIYMGEEDTNDATQFLDAYSEDDQDLIHNLIGSQMMPHRYNKTAEIYKSLKIPAQFVTYKGIGHDVSKKIVEDMIEFFRVNTGTNMNTIKFYNGTAHYED